MLWEWRGIANMDFIQLGGSSRVGEMILARERSGFAGEKTYFNLQPHLNDETVIKINGEDKTVGSLVRAGLQRDFARRYRDKK
ncbi:hypothetical protein Tco_1374622, partial [Tanacetum coccineum]